jgi:ribonuclease BN (tRNA processing enzyme)
MPLYVVRHSEANHDADAPLPEWLVVDSRYDDDPKDEWIVTRHSFPEEAEAEAEKLNTEEG